MLSWLRESLTQVECFEVGLTEIEPRMGGSSVANIWPARFKFGVGSRASIEGLILVVYKVDSDALG